MIEGECCEATVMLSLQSFPLSSGNSQGQISDMSGVAGLAHLGPTRAGGAASGARSMAGIVEACAPLCAGGTAPYRDVLEHGDHDQGHP